MSKPVSRYNAPFHSHDEISLDQYYDNKYLLHDAHVKCRLEYCFSNRLDFYDDILSSTQLHDLIDLSRSGVKAAQRRLDYVKSDLVARKKMMDVENLLRRRRYRKYRDYLRKQGKI